MRRVARASGALRARIQPNTKPYLQWWLIRYIVARHKHVVPKQRRVARLPSGYYVRESRDDSQGSYWYVVTALDAVRPRNASPVDEDQRTTTHRVAVEIRAASLEAVGPEIAESVSVLHVLPAPSTPSTSTSTRLFT